ncbi:calumenin [Coccinella septempunctata]|uniref:calumenin n=1 Tax=Coccinella septempunctata TaxID=41139 RepID=UPI001D090596|nr:calumenin [Coccinella septempunctata]XP_044749530.1 calumenin [Coccinella septempunctata]
MRKLLQCITFIFLAVSVSSKEEKVDRVYNRGLNGKEHFENDIHNKEYDHEAFLGEEAKTFDDLPPEESKRRLGVIVDKIDHDKDGFVTREELRDWIKFTQKRYISEDINKQWAMHNPENNPKLSWEDYEKLVYGFIDFSNVVNQEDENYSYMVMRKRDKRRWQMADKDGDDALSKEEYGKFLHPEEDEYMKDVMILETMEDIDKDNDGKVSLKEYIRDLYRGEDDEEEPDWVKSEREQFDTYRDKDGDGFLDVEEVKNWVIPPDFDHAEAEARHLIYEADGDADGQLTKDEIMSKYDLFVGSQATDFGDALARHDEF